MPRSALSPEQLDGFRERLVAAATTLFARRGYEGVTLRAIASELGCSPMTPYRYFRDKASIFAAVRTDAYSRFADAQDAACAEPGEPAAVLTALGQAYVRFAVESPDAYQLMFELGQPDPDGFPELRAAELRAITPLRTWIGHAVDAGLLVGAPDLLTHVFWSGIHGVASLHLAGKLAFGVGIDALLEPVLQTLFLGNRAQTGSVDRSDR